MADDKRISELPLATTPLAGTEELEIVQGGVNKRVASSNVGGAGSVTSVSGTTNRITSTGGATPVIDIDAAYDAIVAAKAPIASPTFTGTPAAPTAAGGTNTTQIATTAFVTAAVAATTNVVDQVSTSTAGATITLDMNSQVQRSHVGSATFNSAKAIALSNTTNSLFFNFIFEITSVSATLTFPADWISSSPDFNGTVWTPMDIGRFQFGGAFDDTNNLWYITVSGPYI